MATVTEAPLPTDWPSDLVARVKRAAVSYANDCRGPWAVPDVLLDAAVDSLVESLDADAYDVESEDSWFDRFERAVLDVEIRAALEYYSDKIDEAVA